MPEAHERRSWRTGEPSGCILEVRVWLQGTDLVCLWFDVCMWFFTTLQLFTFLLLYLTTIVTSPVLHPHWVATSSYMSTTEKSESGGTAETETDAPLKRQQGLIPLTALGVGAVISGDFFGWNFGLERGGFAGLIIATLLVGFMYVCVSLSLAELAAMYPSGMSVIFICTHNNHNTSMYS